MDRDKLETKLGEFWNSGTMREVPDGPREVRDWDDRANELMGEMLDEFDRLNRERDDLRKILKWEPADDRNMELLVKLAELKAEAADFGRQMGEKVIEIRDLKETVRDLETLNKAKARKLREKSARITELRNEILALKGEL